MDTQPTWSIQLCELLNKNMINPIDAMEYTKAIEDKMGLHHKEYALAKVNQLYKDRINA